MALQDLTPQLRTRLSRMERAVGWFVFFAVALLLFGFGYYIYQTAKNRGWFVIKAKFHTYVTTSAGLNVGDPILMMGFPVGQVTSVFATPPGDPDDVRVDFEIREPYFRYIWQNGSVVKVIATGFLNQRQLEVTRGTSGYAWCVTQPVFDKTIDQAKQLVDSQPGLWQLAQDVFDAKSNIVFDAYTMLDETNLEQISGLYTMVGTTRIAPIASLSPPSNTICVYDNRINRNHVVGSWHGLRHRYVNFTPDKDSAWLKPVESIGLADRLDTMMGQVEKALPNFLALTNQIITILNNGALATSNLNATLVDVRPAMTNIVALTALLREPGAVGVMALGTNGPGEISGTLANVNALLVNSDTNLNALFAGVAPMLFNLSDITSNLNAQVQANPTMLLGVNKTIGDADDFLQGLKRHWLLRSAFKHKPAPGTNSVAH